jgi:hypothetical protein
MSTAEGNGIPHIMAQYTGNPDDVADDVAKNHVRHMTECTACTWWYCETYPCDCHESCVGRHDAAGNPIEVVA